ncbi:GH36-type glycosyl hydrolase domain-containing protein [Segetibacter koreensis]|uniref:GH36-type glycosyl hydrolase domain-containing protein n=1 Tax=Segetibacter koreensis TaxID=398037 RepID=UPI0003665243|nr:hypothetical protein [Segetibacter koreensis]
MPVSKIIFSLSVIFCLSVSFPVDAQTTTSSETLAKQILADKKIDSVFLKAKDLISKGFTAGSGYGEIWIRDFNTFINASLDVGSPEEVKQKLLLFFKFQGDDGNIVDGLIQKSKASAGYKYRYSALDTNWAAHKNTVETDQETSLIQAVKKYIDKTNDYAFLNEKVGDATVLERMIKALAYLDKDRMVKEYGLIKGATTIDWGDVQPETGWGVAINDKTKWAVDIYDNAMLLIAMNDLMSLLDKNDARKKKLEQNAVTLKHNIRKYLWNEKTKKYIPHIYLDGSPFPKDFDEQQILYTGGTTCAILAGIHTEEEIREINNQFLKAAASEPKATIGITVHPPYPTSVFPNMAAYTYQNAGDWTWFGGRMIQALIQNGFYKEAYDEMVPMLDRILQYNGFYEWWDVKTGKPKGSGEFRGEAGVLYDAINMIKKWTKQNR